MEHRDYENGDRVFREGDAAVAAYLVVEGRVEIWCMQDENAIVISQIGKGELFGEMALLESRVRTTSARCLEPTTLTIVPKEEFDRRMNSTDPVVQRIIQQLIRRLRKQNKALIESLTVGRKPASLS